MCLCTYLASWCIQMRHKSVNVSAITTTRALDSITKRQWASMLTQRSTCNDTCGTVRKWQLAALYSRRRMIKRQRECPHWHRMYTTVAVIVQHVPKLFAAAWHAVEAYTQCLNFINCFVASYSFMQCNSRSFLESCPVLSKYIDTNVAKDVCRLD